MDAISRLRELAEFEPLAARLLARMTGDKAALQAARTAGASALKRSAADAIIEGLFLPPIGEPNTPGATRRRIIGFLKSCGGWQTTLDIADACGLQRPSVLYHLQHGPFVREGLRPVRWAYNEPPGAAAPPVAAESQGGLHVRA